MRDVHVEATPTTFKISHIASFCASEKAPVDRWTESTISVCPLIDAGCIIASRHTSR